MQQFSRAVVCAVGSGGDVLPFMEIAAALTKMGLQTSMLGPERYRQHADERGFQYLSIGADDVFAEVFDGEDVWDPKRGTAAAWKYYTAAMRSGYRLLKEFWPVEGTLLVSSSFALAARLAEDADGYANATVHLSPSVIFSAVSPPKWPANSIPPGWPLWLKRTIVGAAERFALDPQIAPGINKFRQELGLEKIGKVFSRWIHSPRRVVYGFPEWFSKAASDWPQQGVHAGFPMQRPSGDPLPYSVSDFLASSKGSPIVLVTGGTAVATCSWMKQCIQGATSAGAKVIAVSPRARLQDSDENVLWVRFVPFDVLFRKINLVVHHGGIGTMAEALRAGVRQIAVPTAHDQFDNADRLQKHGFGLAGESQWSTSDFAGAIASALADPETEMQQLRCRRLMTGQESGAEVVAALALGRDLHPRLEDEPVNMSTGRALQA